MQHRTPTFVAADFSIAYEYLERCEQENRNVNWAYLVEEPCILADVLLLRIMHNVVRERN